MPRKEEPYFEKNRLCAMTIADCLAERVKKTPESVAVEFEGQKVTWREMDILSDWLALRFEFLGIKKGTHAAIWCGNHLQWILVYFGLQKIGALTVLVNPGYQSRELYDVLAYARTEYLFYGETFKDMDMNRVLEELDLRQHPYLKQTIPIELPDAIEFMVEGAKKMAADSHEKVQALSSKIAPEDVACMLFTSGTTSRPKGVMLSHSNLINDAIATVTAMHWDEQDKTCVMVPLFHCFGMTSCLLSSVIAGNSLYVMKHYRTSDALSAISNVGCTVLNGVPSMFLAMIYNKAFESFQLTTLKSGIIAGSPVSAADYRLICERLKMDHLQMSYGQTETSPGVSFSDYDDPIEEKCDNAGTLIPGIEACVWDADGVRHEIPDCNSTKKCDSFYVKGEIGIRGFPVMQGYFEREEETAEALEPDGWLHTGDIGYIDEKRRLHIAGRKKEMIIRGGENISPVEIEECIRELPGVKEAKVVGIPAKVLQEEIAAAIVLRDGTTLTSEEVRKYVENNLARYKVPRYVAFMEQLPVNASGKIMTGELKKIMINRREHNDFI